MAAAQTYITEHPEQAVTALAAERAGRNRGTLISWLEAQHG